MFCCRHALITCSRCLGRSRAVLLTITTRVVVASLAMQPPCRNECRTCPSRWLILCCRPSHSRTAVRALQCRRKHSARRGDLASACIGAQRRPDAAQCCSAPLWDAPSVWIDRVCSKLVRNLSRSEWKQYLGNLPGQTRCPDLPAPTTP